MFLSMTIHRFLFCLFFFSFLFFDSRPGSCQPISLLIANKSFSSAKAALVSYFRVSGKNPRHLGCRNIIITQISQKLSDSAVILAIAVSKRFTQDFEYWIFGYCTIRPFQNNVFKEYFFSVFADFGVPFSINFHSFSTFLGFRKALEQDAMSSSDSAVRFLVC